MNLKKEMEKSSVLPLESLLNNIIIKLKESDYEVRKESSSVITFTLTGSGVIGKQVDKVSEGRFEVVEKNSLNIAKFTFSKSLNYPIVVMIGLILSSIFVDIEILYLTLIFSFFIYIQWMIAKTKCSKILKIIVDKPL